MDEKTFDEIMQEIVMGLERDPEHDGPYLREQMEAYKDHPLATEIVRACSRLLWDLMPDDKRQELEKTLNNHRDTSRAILDETFYNQKMGKPEKSLELIEPLAEKYDDLVASGWNAEDSESVYFNFESPLEELLWRVNHEDEERTVRLATGPFARVYLAHASVLYELGRYEDAISAAKKSIRWNPANPEFRFELGESYKKLGDMDAYARILDELFPYIANPQMMARFHRAKGFMFIDLERYELAAAHLVYSTVYQQSEVAMSELMFMKLNRGADFTDMTPDVAAEVLERAGEPVVADRGALRVLVAVMQSAMKNDDLRTAAQAAVDLYGLTGDDEVGDVAQALVEAVQGA